MWGVRLSRKIVGKGKWLRARENSWGGQVRWLRGRERKERDVGRVSVACIFYKKERAILPAKS